MQFANPDPISDQNKIKFSHQFSDLGYLPFTWEIRKFWMGNQMVFTDKITYNPTNVPMIFKGTLTLASEVHSYNTRFVSTRNSHRPRIRNNYGVYLIFREYMAMLKNLSRVKISYSHTFTSATSKSIIAIQTSKSTFSIVSGRSNLVQINKSDQW